MFTLSTLASPYPQRYEHYEPTWLNRFSERCRTWFLAHVRFRASHLQKLAQRVDVEGAQWLAGLPADERSDRIAELRHQVHRHGFSDETLVVRLLAVVRQAAFDTLGLRPHLTQIIGAYILMHGQIAEMDTGEGKSLTAAVAAACAGLAGCKVHVVTVNDYLAQRDTEGFREFFAALGLTVNVVTEAMQHEEKALPYRADIVYCANKIVVFDYLRDRLALGEEVRPLSMALDTLLGTKPRSSLLPGLQFAIVDEADSVFIDEARTPLVIAKEIDDPERAQHYEQTIELARMLIDGVDFVLSPGVRFPYLTEAGAARLADIVNGSPDVFTGLWAGPRLREDAVLQGLSALYGFQRDIDYIVQDGKAMIVDENTGRVMPDRTWERGLQQLIEIKEGLAPTPLRENIARLSYQLFFRRYLNLAGMSGTCREVASELGEVYGLGVVRVEPYRPSRRKQLPTQLFAYAEERWDAVVQAVKMCQAKGQPVLVGTRSIRASEHLAGLLDQAGVSYRALNAKQNAEEAAIVALAGQRGQVTIATNMAGRGTDIKLGDGVVALGGLHVILTEGHDNTRVDRQLAGRCARQGDPGSWQALLSLEDEIVQVMPTRGLALLQHGLSHHPSMLAHGLAKVVYRLAQTWVSMRQRGERGRLLLADFGLRQALSFSGVAE